MNKFQAALAKYGISNCLWAVKKNDAGEGPSNIGFCLDLTVSQANAAINAGRWLAEQSLQDVGPGNGLI